MSKKGTHQTEHVSMKEREVRHETTAPTSISYATRACRKKDLRVPAIAATAATKKQLPMCPCSTSEALAPSVGGLGKGKVGSLGVAWQDATQATFWPGPTSTKKHPRKRAYCRPGTPLPDLVTIQGSRSRKPSAFRLCTTTGANKQLLKHC